MAEAARRATSAEERQTLIGALAGVDNPQAHDALRALLSVGGEAPTADDHAILRGAMMALAVSPRASATAAADLLGAADRTADPTTRGAALLAAGGQARVLSDTDQEAADLVTSRLVARAASHEGDPKRVATVIAALGNSGGDEGLPSIRAALEHPVWQVRMAAAYALRHYPGPEIDALLRRTFLSDPVHDVRAEAIATVTYRDITQFAGPLGGALIRDPAVRVRGAVLALLEGHPEWVVMFTPALRLAHEQEPDDGLRTRCQALLGAR